MSPAVQASSERRGGARPKKHVITTRPPVGRGRAKTKHHGVFFYCSGCPQQASCSVFFCSAPLGSTTLIRRDGAPTEHNNKNILDARVTRGGAKRGKTKSTLAGRLGVQGLGFLRVLILVRRVRCKVQIPASELLVDQHRVHNI